MKLGFVSIDDFYPDPDKVRNIALSSTYYAEGVSEGYKSGNAPWPGKMSIDPYYTNYVDITVSKLLNKNLRQLRNLDSSRFRVSSEGTKSVNVCHADTIDSAYYAGVLYLNKNNNAMPGTIFYTHTETNSDSVTSIGHLENIIKNKHDKNIDCWSINMISNICYNRLIVYPANKFHGPGPSFGTGDDARLVQIFCWEEII